MCLIESWGGEGGYGGMGERKKGVEAKIGLFVRVCQNEGSRGGRFPCP